MKPMLLTLCCTLFLALWVSAQEPVGPQEHIPRWVPTKGYWVVETNIHTTGTTVFFYNQHHDLVYQEAVVQRLNLDRRKTLMRLNRALETAVANHERQATSTNLVAAQFAH